MVLGGDWNCTYSNENVNHNLDCLNMVNLPNLRHTNLLLQMCDEFDLTDP